MRRTTSTRTATRISIDGTAEPGSAVPSLLPALTPRLSVRATHPRHLRQDGDVRRTAGPARTEPARWLGVAGEPVIDPLYRFDGCSDPGRAADRP